MIRLLVNDGVGTPRRLRAVLHNAAQTGLEAQNREGREDFLAYLAGMISHVAAANPAQGKDLREAPHRLES